MNTDPGTTKNPPDLVEPRQLTTRLAYQNDWMRVREDVVLWPGGHEGIYGVVDKPDFAVILPREDDGFWMVEQYRYPIQRRVWEFPQGSWNPGDDAHGSSPADTRSLAELELREETGLVARRWAQLGRMQEGYGFANHACDIFLATELSQGPVAREDTEVGMTHRWVRDDELLRFIQDGLLVDSVSLAALTLFRIREQQ